METSVEIVRVEPCFTGLVGAALRVTYDSTRPCSTPEPPAPGPESPAPSRLPGVAAVDFVSWQACRWGRCGD